MRSYPALRMTAMLIKVATGIGAVLGLISSPFMMTEGFLFGLLSLVGTFAATLLMWASAELILVFANMGEDVSRLVELEEKEAPARQGSPAYAAAPPAMGG